MNLPINTKCPCCGGAVTAPTIELLLQQMGVLEGTKEARILDILWRGKGLDVPTARIFDAMCADDPNGGPGDNALYNSLKFSLLRLRRKLEGSGVSIQNAGYGRGYRLTMERAHGE